MWRRDRCKMRHCIYSRRISRSVRGYTLFNPLTSCLLVTVRNRGVFPRGGKRRHCLEQQQVFQILSIQILHVSLSSEGAPLNFLVEHARSLDPQR